MLFKFQTPSFTKDFWSFYFPPLIYVLALIFIFIFPDYYYFFGAKDHEGGVVENLTFIALLPGIFIGVKTLIYFFKKTKLPFVFWIALWSLAMFYFAGEEVSWGQWWFRWKTPESIALLNEQNETNLHNMSSYLNQYPRTLVELYFLFLPLLHFFPNLFQLLKKKIPYGDFILPEKNLLICSFLFLSVTLIKPIGKILNFDAFVKYSTSEQREYFLAVALTLYMFRLVKKYRSLL